MRFAENDSIAKSIVLVSMRTNAKVPTLDVVGDTDTSYNISNSPNKGWCVLISCRLLAGGRRRSGRGMGQAAAWQAADASASG